MITGQIAPSSEAERLNGRSTITTELDIEELEQRIAAATPTSAAPDCPKLKECGTYGTVLN